MPLVYLVNRHDHRGTIPIKYYALKENAEFFCGEANTAWKLVKNSENPEEEIELLKGFDKDAEYCYTGIRYSVEEIQTE